MLPLHGPLHRADIAALVQEILAGEGYPFRAPRRCDPSGPGWPSPDSSGLSARWPETKVVGSHVLVAVGRIPNSDRLNLDAAGVEIDEWGYIRVNEVMQTNVPHIFAVGDINGEGAFTHTSVNDGEIFWDYYIGGERDRTLSQRIPTYALFTDPPLGRVGMTEKAARAGGWRVLMATRPMKAIARAREKGETAGMVKILVDGDSEQFLGAAVLGVDGDEVVNIFTPFMYTGQSYRVFRRAVLTHPTVAELTPWILDDLAPLEN